MHMSFSKIRQGVMTLHVRFLAQLDMGSEISVKIGGQDGAGSCDYQLVQ